MSQDFQQLVNYLSTTHHPVKSMSYDWHLGILDSIMLTWNFEQKQILLLKILAVTYMFLKTLHYTITVLPFVYNRLRKRKVINILNCPVFKVLSKNLMSYLDLHITLYPYFWLKNMIEQIILLILCSGTQLKRWEKTNTNYSPHFLLPNKLIEKKKRLNDCD